MNLRAGFIFTSTAWDAAQVAVIIARQQEGDVNPGG